MPTLADRLARVESIVHKQKYEQFEKFFDRKQELMDKTVAEFRDLLQKGEKWVPIAGKFDEVMSRFNEHMKNQLDSANNEVAHAQDLANDITRKLSKMQAEVENWEAEAGIRDIKDKMEKMEKEIENLATEAGIRDIKIKMEKMEKDIESLGTKIMHVAIEQANSEAPTPRGRQTSRQRSVSLQRASRILKGFAAPIDDEADEAEGPHQQELPHQPALLPLTHVRPNTFE